jgi:hypothetical protein
MHLTGQLREAAKPVDIELMAHTIIGSSAGEPRERVLSFL